MKIFKSLLSLILCVLLISCSDDDENTSPVDQDSLIGTWEMISLNVDTDFSGNIGGIQVVSNTNSVGENFDYTLTFTETTFSSSGSYDVVTNGTANGIPLDEDRQTVTDVNESGTYDFVNG